MKALITACLLSMGLLAGTAHAADAKADCAAKSAEKKLAGAAKNSFEKKCMADEKGGAAAAPAAAAKPAAAAAPASGPKK